MVVRQISIQFGNLFAHHKQRLLYKGLHDGAPKKQLIVLSTMLKSSLVLLTAALFCSGVSAQEASISSAASPSSCIQVSGANFKDGTAIVM